MVRSGSVWFGFVIGLAIIVMLPACGGDDENSGGGGSHADAADLGISDAATANDSTGTHSDADEPDTSMPDLNGEVDFATTDALVTVDVDIFDVGESTDLSIAEPHFDTAMTDDVSGPADVAVVPDVENDVG